MAYNPAYNNAMPYGIATFNRQGINSKINFNDPKKILSLEIESYFLKELIGQGTTKLKSFKIIKTNAELNLKKLISNIDKSNPSLSDRNQHSCMDGDFTFAHRCK